MDKKAKTKNEMAREKVEREIKEREKLARKYKDGVELHLSFEEAEVIKAALANYCDLDSFGHSVWCEWGGAIGTKDQAGSAWVASDVHKRLPKDINPNWGWFSESHMEPMLQREWEFEKEEAQCLGGFQAQIDAAEGKSHPEIKKYMKQGLRKRIKRLGKELKKAKKEVNEL